MVNKKTAVITLLSIFVWIGNFVACKDPIVTPPVSDLLFPQVRDIVNTNCVVCHSPGGQGRPLVLDSDSAIVENAALIKAATCDPVSPRNRRMPPTGPLSDVDTVIISEWYAGGGTMNNAGINK